MLNRRRGMVQAIQGTYGKVQELVIQVDGKLVPGINYRTLGEDVYPGDLVEINTTAVDLGLGTGGGPFVISRLISKEGQSSEEGRGPGEESEELSGALGHIMKLRYTPLQLAVPCVEEEDSPYHEVLQAADSLEGMPVMVASLHSLIAPIAVVLQCNVPKGLHLTYIMTDGAALPLGFSRLVASMQKQGFISSTITVGHAFGGDLEAVNIYSGLLAARHVLKADAAIVAMGPGVVGTATPFGTTALETATILDGVNVLEGKAIAVPRVSFADLRPRHYGISHHTLTALGKLCYSKCYCALPTLLGEEYAVLQRQSQSAELSRHDLVFVDQDHTLELLDEHHVKVTSMGRTPAEDPAFFRAGGAAGWLTAQWLCGNYPW